MNESTNTFFPRIIQKSSDKCKYMLYLFRIVYFGLSKNAVFSLEATAGDVDI